MNVAPVRSVLGDFRNRGGFTLVELMVVLAVMGVLVSAALPSIGEGFSDRRVAIVSREVVGIFQRARYMSSAYGRAHQVQYFNGKTAGLAETFAFETLRGTASSCSLNDFVSGGFILTNFGCDDANHWRCVDRLYSNMHDPNPGDNELIRVDGFDNSSYCYEAGSNNQVFVGIELFSIWQAPRAQAGHGFVVYREVNGTPVGVIRKVLIPSGAGAPRIVR